MFRNIIQVFTAFAGATAVALAAYASHALVTVQIKSWLDTAVFYQLIHAVLLICLTHVLPKNLLSSIILGCFTIGITLFCGNLYLLAFSIVTIGVFTPIGGSMLIVAWLLLMALVFYKGK